MPTTPYASVRISVNAGALQEGGVVVVADDLIQLQAASTVGWDTSGGVTRWEITTYPVGFDLPTGWSLDGVTAAMYYLASNLSGLNPPVVTIPSAASGIWGKWKFRLLVNGGGGSLTDWTAAVKVEDPDTGLNELAMFEDGEWDPIRRASKDHNANLKIISAAIAGGVGGGCSLSGAAPTALDGGAAVVGAGLTASPYNHKHLIVHGSPVSIGNVLDDGTSGAFAFASHVHDLPFDVVNATLATADADIDINGFKILNVATPVSSGDAVNMSYADALVNFDTVNAALGAADADIGVNGFKITGLATPTANTDAATKSYVDAMSVGLDVKLSVRGASLVGANHTLSGALTEDGVTYVTGDRYLAKNQTTQSQNGYYVVNTAGSWARTFDADASSEMTSGAFCFVSEGTVNGGTGWVLSTPDPIVLNTTSLTFTQFSGSGSYTNGNGLNLTGTSFSVKPDSDASISVGAGGVKVGVLATDTQHGVRGGGTQHALATDAADGFMPHAHFTLVDDAAYTTTSGVIPIRGSGSEILANYFTNLAGLGAAVTSGIVRAVKNATIVATRAASDAADHVLLSTDSTDGVVLGDLVVTAAATVKMKAAGVFQLLANTTKVITASASNVAFFGDIDAGSGVGVLTLHDASTAPTARPTEGALIHSVKGALSVTTEAGVRTGLNSRGVGAGTATQIEYTPHTGNVDTTTTTPTLILAITVPSVQMCIEVELSVIGYHVDTAYYSRTIVRARRVNAGVVSITSYSISDVPDIDNFGSCTVTGTAGAVNVNDLEIKVVGNASPISWVATAHVTYFKP